MSTVQSKTPRPVNPQIRNGWCAVIAPIPRDQKFRLGHRRRTVACCIVNGKPLCGRPVQASQLKPLAVGKRGYLTSGVGTCAECDEKNDGLWHLAQLEAVGTHHSTPSREV